MGELSFENYGLSAELLKSIRIIGYNTPTNVQEEVIPLVLKERDIIVKSQTGSGKTASFGIPLCDKISIEDKDPQALILSPTRELCVQIKEDITNIGRFKRIRCAAIFGKQPMEEQARELKQRVHIVAATPGRAIDHIERGNFETGKIKYFIIDEADKMLSMGFLDQMETVISALPKNRVTMLFSATIPEKIEDLCQRYMVNPVRLEITPETIAGENIEQEVYEVMEDSKFQLLRDLISVENPGSLIIFCKTKENVGNLFNRMKNKGYSCSQLHGGMLQGDRLETMNKFKRREFKVLIATDVAARGIDIEDVTHIINYDTPVEVESYVHRIGRTGRIGRKGKAITLVSPYEQKKLREIESYIGYEITRKDPPTKEEVDRAKNIPAEKRKVGPMTKTSKSMRLEEEITKVYINAGKKKKIRPGDIVGAITSIDGVKADDIGIIDIQDNFSYIDILNKKGEIVLKALPYVTIKGKTVRAQKAMK